MSLANPGEDLLRPAYHFLPRANWLNDPNGLTYWRGYYHLFYQHNPVAPAPHRIHWGHARSRDLIHWEHLPIALSPDSDGPDADGCWSGCLVNSDGRPMIVYTGLREGQQRPCLAEGDDELLCWRKHPGNPVIAAPPPDYDVIGFRDHSIWRQGGVWMQAIGSGVRGEGGRVWLYQSADLRAWQHVGALLTAPDIPPCDINLGEMWECPDFFALADHHVLIVSVWDQRTLCHAVAFMGAYRDHRLHVQRVARVDYGGRYFYAPQSMIDPQGRRLMWAWIPEGRPAAEIQAAGWAGVMSLPRVLGLSAEGGLTQRFAPELHALRAHAHSFSVSGHANYHLCQTLPLSGRRLEIDATLQRQGATQAGLCVLRSPDGEEETRIEVDWQASELRVVCSRSAAAGEGEIAIHIAPLCLPTEIVNVKAYLDHSVLEVIANEATAITTRCYPTRSDSAGLAAYCSGPAQVDMMVYELESIW